MQRFAAVIQVKPEMLETYLELHQNPHPEVLETLHRVGVRNYSIFLHAHLLFSYLEFLGDDWEAAQQQIARDPATQLWWTLTDPCQTPLETARPGERWAAMPSVFFME